MPPPPARATTAAASREQYPSDLSRVRGAAGDLEEEHEATFSSLHSKRQPIVDIDAIEREVDALLADPLGTAQAPASATAAADIDVELSSFLSHQPQYQRSIIAKKLQLYEKTIALREKQIATLAAMHGKAVAAAENLKVAMDKQQLAFREEQLEWEEEKAGLLRFRGGAASEKSSAVMFQMSMGMSAAAMAARARQSNEAETQQQRALRMQMLNGAVELQDQLENVGADELATHNSRSASRLLWLRIRRFINKHLYPFATDIRQIEARFGYSVASYFRFFRWIIMSFMVISIPSLVALILHVLLLLTLSHSSAVAWTKFAGAAPAIALLPQYHEIEGLLYTLVLVIMQATLLLLTIRKWISEDRQAKTMEAMDGGSNKPKFGRIVLNAWDFSTTKLVQASDLRKSIAEQVKVTLADEEMALTVRRRTRTERYKLYARRVVAFLLYVVVQAASWYVIILVTTQSAEIQQYIATHADALAPYVASLVPALVTVINGILPTIISLLTGLEKWDDVGFAIKALVTRLYLAKVLNVLIQLVSYALLLDPYLLTAKASILGFALDGAAIRSNVILAFKQEMYACRAEQVASGLVNLVVTDFAIGKAAAVVTPVVMMAAKAAAVLITRLRERRRNRSRVIPTADDASDTNQENADPSQTRPPSAVAVSRAPIQIPASSQLTMATLLKKSEFQVPQKMVALLYSCTIGLVSIPLAPSASILVLVLHVLNFKFDKAVLMYAQKKPMVPWDAKDAGSFFVKFYFCTVSIFILFTHFFLANTRLPKRCDLQDTLLLKSGESICLDGSYNPASEVCALNTTRSSSAHFQGRECSSGYPKCVCSGSLACGPFTSSSSGYELLVIAMKEVEIIALAYETLVANTFVAWIVVIAFVMGAFFVRNSLYVHLMVATTREHEVALSVATLRKKIKQLENKLRVHRMTHSNGN